MKKVLAVVIAVAFISIGAVSSDAQVPNVQIYFDSNLNNTQADCGGFGTLQDLYVVCNNFNALISSMEFGVDFGPNFPLIYLSDVHNSGVLALGQSYQPAPGISGVTISYPIPGNGFFPFIAMQISAIWQCDECDLGGANLQPITVVPHGTTGKIQAVVFETFETIDGIGMQSLVCPGPISTEEATWGKVKALYN